MKKSVLTIALAVATALALSQPAALAKSSKGGRCEDYGEDASQEALVQALEALVSRGS